MPKKNKNYRPNKIEYYLGIAEQVSKRSTCMSRQGGTIIVRDDQIVATGYTGAPRKTMDCYERGFCLRRELGIPSGHRYEICRSVHAEMNAIINAARSGASLLGGDLYNFGRKIYQGQNELASATPCFICKKMIINSGINRVISRIEDGNYKIFEVEKWAQDWAKKDMLDDMDIYNSNYRKVSKNETKNKKTK